MQAKSILKPFYGRNKDKSYILAWKKLGPYGLNIRPMRPIFTGGKF